MKNLTNIVLGTMEELQNKYMVCGETEKALKVVFSTSQIKMFKGEEKITVKTVWVPKSAIENGVIAEWIIKKSFTFDENGIVTSSIFGYNTAKFEDILLSDIVVVEK